MTTYVAGFLFDHGHRRVALIQKARPAWQRGRLNGIGGKVEMGETPLQAMVREFHEEAGDGDGIAWTERVVLHGPDWTVHFFSATSHVDHLFSLRGQEDEPIRVVQTAAGHLPEEVLPNLRWLIPLCMDGDVVRAVVSDSTAPGQGQTQGVVNGQ